MLELLNMNALTKQIVAQVAKDNKALALRNDSAFAHQVRVAHWQHLLAEHGIDLKQRALDLWQRCHPEMFDDQGWLKCCHCRLAACDIALSHIAARVLQRKIARTPALQLTPWGDYPVTIAQPQMNLFD